MICFWYHICFLRWERCVSNNYTWKVSSISTFPITLSAHSSFSPFSSWKLIFTLSLLHKIYLFFMFFLSRQKHNYSFRKSLSRMHSMLKVYSRMKYVLADKSSYRCKILFLVTAYDNKLQFFLITKGIILPAVK